MKKYSLYFLSLILTVGFWASPSLAQDGQWSLTSQAPHKLQNIKPSKQSYVEFEASNVKYINNLATYAELYNQDGELVCIAEGFTPHDQYKNVVVTDCGEFKVSSYLAHGHLDKFVFSVYNENSKLVAVATKYRVASTNEANLNRVSDNYQYTLPTGPKW